MRKETHILKLVKGSVCEYQQGIYKSGYIYVIIIFFGIKSLRIEPCDIELRCPYLKKIMSPNCRIVIKFGQNVALIFKKC